MYLLNKALYGLKQAPRFWYNKYNEHLNKALYGLKQAPRVWYNKYNEHLDNLGFTRSPNEHTFYVKQIGGDLMIVPLYVYDLLETGSNLEQLNWFKDEMHKEFEMTDLGKS